MHLTTSWLHWAEVVKPLCQFLFEHSDLSRCCSFGSSTYKVCYDLSMEISGPYCDHSLTPALATNWEIESPRILRWFLISVLLRSRDARIFLRTLIKWSFGRISSTSFSGLSSFPTSRTCFGLPWTSDTGNFMESPGVLLRLFSFAESDRNTYPPEFLSMPPLWPSGS